MITERQLRQMMPNAGARLDPHLPFIVPAMIEGHIDTPKRITAFLAQLAHESGEYRYMQELADGSAYEGRSDLGNIHPGDGVTFKGHGPMQITGRNNHLDCGEVLGLDLIADPLLITMPEHGTRAAVWFWNSRQLSLLADRNWFKAMTVRINGGMNGFSDRRMYWDRNRALLGLPLVDTGQEGADIMAFQRSRGLVADGMVGHATMRALAIPVVGNDTRAALGIN